MTNFTSNLSNTVVLTNSSLTLSCVTNANPPALFYLLYYNGAYIGNNSLGVLRVTVMEDGVYTCVPVNKVGAGDNGTVSVKTVGKFIVLTL